jgi:hypothetical protein
VRLPKNLLNTGTYTKPRVFLCETDKTPICQLETIGLEGSFKFNSYSEINFEVARVYNDLLTGTTKINPFYDKIEALRLIELENFGYFEIQGTELVSNGIEEKKSITAYSLEYTLSQKYLEDFYVNTGEIGAVEVKHDKYTETIVLYNPSKPTYSLLHLILEKIYGWKIGHVDYQLRTLSRQFEIDRESVYDFIINELCPKFNCYVVFDTFNNTINLYAESPTARFIGDGHTKVFKIGSEYSDDPIFSSVQTVAINGYKTTQWIYSIADNFGILTLDEAPEAKADIEIVGVDSTWETDVFITFDNLAKEINVSYDSDDIKTVLTVTYGDDYDIRDVNLGLPYLTDLSYYYNVDWMGQELYDAYTAYLEKSNGSQAGYSSNSKEILKYNDHIYYEEYRLSLEYSLVQSVSSATVGTYYVKTENLDGSFYYTEVSLPSEYKAGTDYYSNVTTNVNETKVSNLYSILKSYFFAYYNNTLDDSVKANNMLEALERLKGQASDDFKFMQTYTIDYLYNGLRYATSDEKKEEVIYNFLDEMWQELGRTPLKLLYLNTYENTRNVNATAGWSQKSNKQYGNYYANILFIKSLEKEIADRDKIIKSYEDKRDKYQKANAYISNELLMVNNFSPEQLVRLTAFLREDELHLDEIIQTSQDNLSSSFKVKRDAVESGRIELQKRCQPQLQFSMDMANIYAIPEFEPIIHNFQLGRIIRVGLRKDYIKQSRLMQVDINFEDFSDFSCDFGELTSLRSQSDIHADLLSQAISAGKSVATNSSYWTKGSDKATSTDLKIQQGLLDAVTQIKAIDGTQGVVIDKYGIKLQKILDDGSIDPHQVWMVNNQILFSDDGFKTSRSALGEVTVGGETYYGLIAEMVLSGYIEGSEIVGGTIKIGETVPGSGKYAFEVHDNGTVTMGGGSSLGGKTVNEVLEQLEKNTNTIQNIATAKMYQVQISSSRPLIIRDNNDIELTCKVISGTTDVTDGFPDSSFNWIRVSGDADADIEWNTSHQGKGNKITITTSEIANNATFSCEVEVQENG